MRNSYIGKIIYLLVTEYHQRWSQYYQNKAKLHNDIVMKRLGITPIVSQEISIDIPEGVAVWTSSGVDELQDALNFINSLPENEIWFMVFTYVDKETGIPMWKIEGALGKPRDVSNLVKYIPGQHEKSMSVAELKEHIANTMVERVKENKV